MRIYCPICNQQAVLSPTLWRCECGNAWEPVLPDFDPDLIDYNDSSVWRYRKLYGLDFCEPRFRMGAGWTPLLSVTLDKRAVMLKPEYFAPTASFKDRGTELMINILSDQGVKRIAEDSSGNAGASVAAYAARAGMQSEVFVPAHASPAKQAQIAVYGANVNPIHGPRSNAKQKAIESVQTGSVYASHAYHPGFLLGQISVAYELWEQLGRRAPDWYIVPVGQGVHLLGVWLGFTQLLAAGLVSQIPKLVAVQAELLNPVCQAFYSNLDDVPEMQPCGTSLAEGLAIAKPIRGQRILQAVRDSGGTCISVQEDQIQSARQDMAARGFYIEPTSATAVAAVAHILALVAADATIVVPLTGSGLKGTPLIA
jgi:threonine synthase